MTVQNKQSGPEVAQTVAQTNTNKIRRAGKSHVDYWAPRLTKRTYTDRDGKEAEVPEFYVRIKHLGRRQWFNLGTPNRAAAAVQAKNIYLSLLSAGWEATLDKYKPDMEVNKDGCTVGQFLSQVKAVSGLKPVTFEIYARKFRTLVSDVFNINDGKKHDYTGKDGKDSGHKEWLESVHAKKLDKLTPEQINKWKVNRLESDNPLQRKHASATVRSILLCSKALFSKEIRKHLTLKLPDPLPFQDIALPKVGNRRYKSEINPALLLQQARQELAESQPELFKVVLLALGAGLRRDEIDKLQWQQIKWDKNLIRVETTEHGATKSSESEADVHVDPGLLEILKSYMPKPGKVCSKFVIESPVKPRPQSVRNHHYRCNRLFKKLIHWLRSKGVKARNAVHSLRKEFGSQICAQAGIYAASTALRHSSIVLTRDVYTDTKQPAVLEIGKLLNPVIASENGKTQPQHGVA